MKPLTGKETTKTRNFKTAMLAVIPAAVLALSTSDAFADPALHLQKDCSDVVATMGAPGSYCTIASSSLNQIPVGSKIFYDQGYGALAPPSVDSLIDSNVILETGNGNRARGRCTFDLNTFIGLCTFSDGTGTFAGFQARLNVSLCGQIFCLDGTYGFIGQQQAMGQQQ
jgi:hypothetical protein